MKKTIPTSIARTLFYVEEDAYQKLDAYLSDIRAYFASYTDSKEIIEDIESRIGEKLSDLSSKDKTDKIITDAHIDILIKTMGRPQEFGTDDTLHTQSSEKTTSGTAHRKLYRDKENAIIGGVASGLGLYFGVDPIIIRILFFISIFFGGFGIIAYIFMWFAVPEAKTATQKLEMEGNPVTLDEVKKIIEEKIDEVGGKDGIKKGSEKFRQFIVTITKGFFETFGKVIGAFLKIIALVGTITLVTVLIIAATNTPLSIIGAAQIPAIGFYAVIGILFILVLIPLLFIGLAGNFLMNQKKSSHKTLAGILALIWIIACIAGTVIGFHAIKNQDRYESALSGGDVITTTSPVTDFSKLIVKNSQNVRVIQGEKASIEIKGTERDINHINIVNDNGTLVITKKNIPTDCFFCRIRRSDITITTPLLESLSVENGSNVSFEGNVKTLTVSMQNASRVTLAGTVETLDVEIKNASSLDAHNFVTSAMNLDMENGSRAKINVSGTLKGNLSNASSVEQYGKAETKDIETENGSKVEIR